jgi:glycosyltransferase involved in cell wall biosynthesis
MNPLPLVTIIVPTYNRPDFLSSAIDSLIAQTYRPIEIIVIDDNGDTAARKQTAAILKNYEEINYVRTIFNEQNIGGALSRNRAILLSKGDFITFLDDDDVYLPQKVASQVTFMNKHALDMSFTDVKIYNTQGRMIDARIHDYVISWNNDDLLKQHLMHHLTPTCTYMFRREVLVEIGGFDDRVVSQEYMLMLKMILSNKRIGYLPQCHVKMFHHENGRISVGSKKIEGERKLLDIKRTFYHQLNKKEIRYIEFRFHAAMVFVALRTRRPTFFIKSLILAMLTSPADFFIEMVGFMSRRRGSAT